MPTTRRDFMIGCSSAIAALAGSRLVNVSFAAPSGIQDTSDRILVVLFLRGGMDALHFLAPVNDKDYLAARPANLRLSDSGDDKGLPLSSSIKDLDFRLHPEAARLKELYDSKDLAFIHACGITDGTRSHFEAMDLMERGVPGSGSPTPGMGMGMNGMSGGMKTAPVSPMSSAKSPPRQNLATGWLTRYAQQLRPQSLLPVASGNSALPNSLLGYGPAMPISNAAEFRFQGSDRQLAALRKLYTGADPLHASGTAALSAFDAVQSKLPRNPDGSPKDYAPDNNANYGDSDIGRSLRSVAQLIKMNLGLRVATVDFGGWDTHLSQTYYFPILVQQLSTALHAFYNDLSAYRNKLHIVVQTEFGRRLKSNLSNGTDHGHGGVMMVLGGGARGGQILGNWPGLATDQLDSRADLAVTTDFRSVFAEVLASRFNLADTAALFPNLAPAPHLGLYNPA